MQVDMQLVQLLATLILAVALATLCVIDVRSRRLPDWLTLPLATLGLGAVLLRDPSGLVPHLLAALAGFFCFWAIAALYRRYRGYDGLGLGDAKLLAAVGAWLGPLYLAPVVFIASVLALATIVARWLIGRPVSLQSTVPFGPFLSIGFLGLWFVQTGAVLQ